MAPGQVPPEAGSQDPGWPTQGRHGQGQGGLPGPQHVWQIVKWQSTLYCSLKKVFPHSDWGRSFHHVPQLWKNCTTVAGLA